MSDPPDPGQRVLPPPPAEPPAVPPTAPPAELPAPPLPPVQPLSPAPLPPAPMPGAASSWTPAPPAQSGSGKGRGLVCCLLAIAIVAVLSVGALVGLIFLGAQVSSVPSAAGQGLGTPAPSRAVPTARATPELTRAPAVTPAPMPTDAATPEGTDAPLPSGLTELPHQAPDVEALAPKTVNGLPLTTWSVKGDGWLEMSGLSTADSAAMRQAVAEAGGSFDDFALVVSGRTSVENDPPYFVYIYRVPGPDATFDAVLPLVLGNAGWKAGIEPDKFQTRTVGGKEVHVGTEDMLEQSEHQKGRPYWYEMDAQTLAIVVTEKEEWAIDALSQLP